MKRLVDIIDKMMTTAASIQQQKNNKGTKAAGPEGELEGVQAGIYENYPYFAHKIRDLYYKFIDETAVQATEKCMDEFYCTQIIYWDVVK